MRTVEQQDRHSRVVAEHEAAHVVAYLALGYPIHSVEIYDDFTGLTLSTPEPRMIDAYDSAAIRMAGVVIEDRYRFIELEDRLADSIDAEEGDDISGLSAEMAAYGYQHATLLLSIHERLHSEIAQALIGQRKLTGDDVRTLVDGLAA